MFIRVSGLILLGSALLLAGAMFASGAGLRAEASCGSVVGPSWENPAFGKKGTKWRITANGVACSFAKPWAVKLMKTPWRGEAGTKLRGPAGWKCLPTLGSTVGTRGSPGECRKGGKVFFWGPAA